MAQGATMILLRVRQHECLVESPHRFRAEATAAFLACARKRDFAGAGKVRVWGLAGRSNIRRRPVPGALRRRGDSPGGPSTPRPGEVQVFSDASPLAEPVRQ